MNSTFKVIFSLIMLSWSSLIAGFNISQIMFPQTIDTTPVIHIEKSHFESVVLKITKAAYGSKVDVDTALRIAKCESQLGTQLINSESSARGVYQFTYGTWIHYCQGDVMNEDDNINCFIKLYPIHPEWWKCR